jgi:hypothetical protein
MAAVICISFTKQSPSLTLLHRIMSSIWGVILIKADRVGIIKIRYFV